MKIVLRIVAIILFVVFFGFALKNTQEIALQFFLDYELRGPLVIILLGFFIAGAVLGILAFTPTLFRYRRELGRQKKAMLAMQKDHDEQELRQAHPPQPESVTIVAPQ